MEGGRCSAAEGSNATRLASYSRLYIFVNRSLGGCEQRTEGWRLLRLNSYTGWFAFLPGISSAMFRRRPAPSLPPLCYAISISAQTPFFCRRVLFITYMEERR